MFTREIACETNFTANGYNSQSSATNTAEASDLDSGERVDRARYMYLAFAEIE